MFGVLKLGKLGASMKKAELNPRTLFSASEPGAWYDPSDYSTMFEDSAGTIPITSPLEKPVGMMLDKSKGLVLGAEEVINGDNEAALFSTATGPSGTRGTVTRSTDLGVAAAKFTANASGATYINPYAGTRVPAGKAIRVSYRVYIPTAWTGAGIKPVDTVDGSLSVAAVATRDQWVSVSFIRPAKSSPWLLGIGDSNTVDHTGQSFYIDALSIRELHGNHAYQSTSTSRPVLSARVNILTYTEQFDNAVWTKTNSTVAATIAPDGSSTAWAIKDTASAADHFVASYVGTQLTQSWAFNLWLKAGSQRYARVHLYNGTAGVVCDTFFDLQNNGQVVSGGAGVTWTITPGNNGWIQFSGVTTTITGGANHGIYIYAANTAPNSAYLGDGSAAIYVWHPDLRPTNSGVNLPPYQRVGASTDYDTAGFPAYLKFDGIDDSLVTNSIDFTATDKMTVCAGVRKLSDAAVGIVAEFSPDVGANNGSFCLLYPRSATINEPAFTSKGTIPVLAGNEATSFAAPISSVLGGIGNISGDSVILRVNGTKAAQSTADQGTGNYGNYPLYIGRRGGTTLPFNGNLYGLIVRGAQTPLSQIEATELYIKKKMRMP